MHQPQTPARIGVALLIRVLLVAGASAALAVDPHAGHQQAAQAASPSSATSTASGTPPLRIVMPQAGDIVGTRVAVVIETPANLADVTMDAPKVGTHLHIALGDTTLMPVRSDLIALGGQRYLYQFDLPVEPGEHLLQVYWSDASHQTLAATIQSITIQVCAAADTR